MQLGKAQIGIYREPRRIGCVVRALDSHPGVVGLNPRRGFTPMSTQVWHGVTSPKPRPVVRLGGLTYPVIQVYGRPNSVTKIRLSDSVTGSACALYPLWGLDVLSNERRLVGECVCKCPLR